MTASVTTYKAALKEARTSFEKASKRLAELNWEHICLTDEMARLRRTITALAAQCSEEPAIDQLGITESCMEVMESLKYAASTANVVSALEAMGFDLKGQKNANASVHAVLNRLARRNKITKETDESGVVLWKGPNYDPNAYNDSDIPF